MNETVEFEVEATPSLMASEGDDIYIAGANGKIYVHDINTQEYKEEFEAGGEEITFLQVTKSFLVYIKGASKLRVWKRDPEADTVFYRSQQTGDVQVRYLSSIEHKGTLTLYLVNTDNTLLTLVIPTDLASGVERTVQRFQGTLHAVVPFRKGKLIFEEGTLAYTGPEGTYNVFNFSTANYDADFRSKRVYVDGDYIYIGAHPQVVMRLYLPQLVEIGDPNLVLPISPGTPITLLKSHQQHQNRRYLFYPYDTDLFLVNDRDMTQVTRLYISRNFTRFTDHGNPIRCMFAAQNKLFTGDNYGNVVIRDLQIADEDSQQYNEMEISRSQSIKQPPNVTLKKWSGNFACVRSFRFQQRRSMPLPASRTYVSITLNQFLTIEASNFTQAKCADLLLPTALSKSRDPLDSNPRPKD